MKRWLIMIVAVVVLVLVIGGIWGFNLYNTIQGFKKPQPPTVITAMQVGYEEWRNQLTAVGSTRAVRGADLSAEVDGMVDSIHFESGQDVKQGEVLVQLRDDDLLAQLDSLKASAELARINQDRDQQQFSAQAISRSIIDTDAANYLSAQAQVKQQQALIDKRHIRAPFGGRVGIRAVDLGQYLKAGDKVVTLQTLDPIYADFNLPQQALSQIEVRQAVSVKSDSFADQNFSGTITAIDPKIDTDTRNVQLRATIKNADHKLLPGMFVNMSVDVGQPQRYLTLPQTAITFNPYGETVFIVTTPDKLGDPAAPDEAKAAPGTPAKDDKTPVAKQVLVTVGPTRGDQIAVLTGIKEGDQVVTSGQLKLKNGTPVKIDNKIMPSNDANPTPPNE